MLSCPQEGQLETVRCFGGASAICRWDHKLLYMTPMLFGSAGETWQRSRGKRLSRWFGGRSQSVCLHQPAPHLHLLALSSWSILGPFPLSTSINLHGHQTSSDTWAPCKVSVWKAWPRPLSSTQPCHAICFLSPLS